eukprot:9468232-Pyramimonas_sp.AAC.1
MPEGKSGYWLFTAVLLVQFGDRHSLLCRGQRTLTPCVKKYQNVPYVHNEVNVVEGPRFIYVPMRKTSSRYITKVLGERYGGFACHGTGEGFLKESDSTGRKVTGRPMDA